MNATIEADDLLNKKEAAALLRISKGTLDNLPDLPRIKITARRVVFRRSALIAYINARANEAA